MGAVAAELRVNHVIERKTRKEAGTSLEGQQMNKLWVKERSEQRLSIRGRKDSSEGSWKSDVFLPLLGHRKILVLNILYYFECLLIE